MSPVSGNGICGLFVIHNIHIDTYRYNMVYPYFGGSTVGCQDRLESWHSG